jgi:hypothetical protein
MYILVHFLEPQGRQFDENKIILPQNLSINHKWVRYEIVKFMNTMHMVILGLFSKQACILHHFTGERGTDRWKICKLYNVYGPVKSVSEELRGRYTQFCQTEQKNVDAV